MGIKGLKKKLKGINVKKKEIKQEELEKNIITKNIITKEIITKEIITKEEEIKRQKRRILLYLTKILKNNTLYFIEKYYKNYENYFIVSCIIKQKIKKQNLKKDKVENKQIVFCLKTILHPLKKKYLLKNMIIKIYFNKILFF